MKRNELFFLLLLILSNLFLRLYRIDYAGGQPIFDEKSYYLEAARSYLENKNDPNIEHPPLGKMLIASGMKIFGDNPLGWRIMSAVFSLLGILLVYLLSKEMFGGFFIPTVSSLFVSLDNLYFIHSRLAVPEIFLAVFILGTLFFLWRYCERGQAGDLLLLSVSFGLALSTKWTALLIVPAIILFLALRDKTKKTLLKDLAAAACLSSAVYALSYAPYILRNSFWGFAALQGTIVGFWRNFGGTVRWSPAGYFLSHAFSWIFDPGWDYDIRVLNENRVGIVNALFNPFIFWLSLFYGAKTINGFRMNIDRRLLFLTLPAILNFVPWFFVGRIQYLYYFLFSIPFLYILTAYHLEKVSRGNDGKYKTVWVVITALLVFLFFYPLSSSVPVTKLYLSPLRNGPLVITTFKGKSLESITLR